MEELTAYTNNGKTTFKLGPNIVMKSYYCNCEISSVQVKLMTNNMYNNVVIKVSDQYFLKYVEA